jgi:2-oxoisovalerate dehydrogenase E1 component
MFKIRITMEEAKIKTEKKTQHIPESTLLKAYRLMHTANALAELYEENKAITAKYVHATSRGHEAIQLACGL